MRWTLPWLQGESQPCAEQHQACDTHRGEPSDGGTALMSTKPSSLPRTGIFIASWHCLHEEMSESLGVLGKGNCRAHGLQMPAV